MTRLIELIPIQPPMPRPSSRSEIRRITIDKTRREKSTPPPQHPQPDHSIEHLEAVPRSTIDRHDETSPGQYYHTRRCDITGRYHDLGIKVKSNIQSRRTLAPHHSTTSKERLNIHLVRRHLIDDLLVDSRPRLRTYVTHDRS
jgi:hypothetical protein